MVNNRILGRARAGLALAAQDAGLPDNNTFVRNDLTGFKPALTEVFVDEGATNTLVIGKRGKGK